MFIMSLYVVAIVASFCYLDTGQAYYLLEVKIHSYSNPSHTDVYGNCCDWNGCDSMCGNTFQICPFNSTSHPNRATDCPLGLQSFRENDNIEGLNRTLVFNGISWPGYLNLSIDVYHQYTIWYSAPVDQFFLQKIPVMVANNFTGTTAYLGVHQNGNISLSFRVTCKQNYSGPSCDAKCPNIGPCNASTLNTCAKNTCLNGGTCTLPSMIMTYRCLCTTGYTGQSCETTTMNTCNQFSPCQNGATCTILPSGRYNCSCANGFSGFNCINRTIAASVTTTSATDVTSATDAINNFNCTDAAACVGTSKLAGIKATASPGDVMEAVDAAKGQAGTSEIAGVVVTLIVVVTLGIVGAVTVAVFIVHKRSKKNTDEGLGTCVDTANNNPTYDQNAVGLVALPLTAPPLEIDFHNPVYSSSGIADAMGSSVLVSDYELPIMEYEVVKEREQSSMHATLGPETVYHEA